MSDKPSRFPLSLSSVVDKKKTANAGRDAAGRPQATTQTAAKNAAQSSQRAALKPVQQGLAQALRPPPAPPRAPVAPAQPLLSAAPVPRTAVRNVMTVTQTNASHHASPLASEAVRKAMVARVAKQGVADAKVLAALEAVPRHMFVEPGLASQAYIDASLPIGHHQTISQPYIVARMIELMRQNRNGGRLDRVLEIGTGCGYQAAVLSRVAGEVYSIERIKPLHELAKTNLRPLRVANIRLHYGDGMLGLPQVAPFDGIILAAAGLEVPQALLEQLAIGGRLVAPVGERQQVLELIERVGQRDWRRTTLEQCHFVPLRPGTA
ncbi:MULTISPECIES: protein-L-isoaspartate(D-aspartate) O-methyltransferase [Herbaspirillum]|jgi:protein-L-isoaspartate(D-aspartate) O-methyltransferase|uniref:Protein-L-isoaspartate O-methyltransferase n=1 Tax=Herbaspirillum aquaticum TaxID=568783 RepID=A0A225T3J4_9BURK|nr:MULTISPECIES: protein-L-isoaspartate(D-aspartate) O-methyltransferase [Herbaspirillum]MBW9335339.1 protein-L-isoaspartate(D-aspartate) O-methyltransferase [Herbaspirillum sp. RU 5E]MRT29275.1 protein-L-isoaspartate(D-aspartate) O-methyltransferase [Herbaspirillum sp. CAH-3]OWY36671.1 protein-L-isoaspartate O-methyltransferase [Herbaspirillum aquaticum]